MNKMKKYSHGDRNRLIVVHHDGTKIIKNKNSTFDTTFDFSLVHLCTYIDYDYKVDDVEVLHISTNTTIKAIAKLSQNIYVIIRPVDNVAQIIDVDNVIYTYSHLSNNFKIIDEL